MSDTLRLRIAELHTTIAELRQRIAELTAERDRLREAIEGAPHDEECDALCSVPYPNAAGTEICTGDLPCNCWKHEALK